jgi:adenosine deaminase
MTQHPIKKMLSLGLNATVNSDDPAYFGGYMNDNYRALIQQTGINKDQLLQLAKNGINCSWMDEPTKSTHLQALDALFH